MVISVNEAGVNRAYTPFITEMEGFISFLEGTEDLAIAGILKIAELIKGEKFHFLLVDDNDSVKYYVENGKILILTGVKDMSTVLTVILMGAGFTIWVQRDA